MFKNCHSSYLTIQDLLTALNHKVTQLIIEKKVIGKNNSLKDAILYLGLCSLTIFMALFGFWVSLILSIICTAASFSWINKYRNKFQEC